MAQRNRKPTKRRGYLVIWCGGSGGEAAVHFRTGCEGSGSPFPAVVVCADTEPGENPAADFSLDLSLTADDVAAIRNNPDVVGPVAKLMVERYDRFLTPDSIKNGSRTLRLLTMLAVEFQLELVINLYKQAIRKLIKDQGVDSILPIFVATSGGGAGSGLVVIHSLLFDDPAFRARVTEGLSPHVLETPVAVVSEPFAHADLNYDDHAAKILANAYAFRLETAMLEDCFQYIFHLGMANRGGVLIDDIDELARILGRAVFAFCRHYDHVKARFVDTWDSARLTERYRGTDTPEHHLPADARPDYAVDPPAKPLWRPIQLMDDDSIDSVTCRAAST